MDFQGEGTDMRLKICKKFITLFLLKRVLCLKACLKGAFELKYGPWAALHSCMTLFMMFSLHAAFQQDHR